MESRELALRMADCGLQAGDSPRGEESAQTLKRAKAGDKSAFEQVVVLHQRRVLTTAFRLLGCLEDAQDAAQEVFLKLYRHLHRFDASRDMTPWLYRMTVNVCRDLHRARSRRAPLSLEEMKERTVSPDFEGEIARLEQRRMIAEGLKKLSLKERMALVLRDIEGLSTKEVARILGSSETTVRSQVSTARVKIKKFTDRLMMR